jgi:hypothetical protein
LFSNRLSLCSSLSVRDGILVHTIDQLAKKVGHVVANLSPYLCNCNAISLELLLVYLNVCAELWVNIEFHWRVVFFIVPFGNCNFCPEPSRSPTATHWVSPLQFKTAQASLAPRFFKNFVRVHSEIAVSLKQFRN